MRSAGRRPSRDLGPSRAERAEPDLRTGTGADPVASAPGTTTGAIGSARTGPRPPREGAGDDAEGALTMVTPEEIGGDRALRRARRGRARAALPRRGRHQPRAGRVRGARGRRARALRRARGPHRGGQARRRDRARRRRARARATSSARCRSRSARCSRSASARRSRRASCGSRRTTTTPSRPSRPTSAQEVGRLAANRMGGARGLQGIAAEPPPPRAIVVGHRWDRVVHGAAPLPRPQPDHVQVAHARRAGRRRSSGAARCRPTRTARRSASSTARPSCGRSSAGSPSCSASAPSPPPRSTTR